MSMLRPAITCAGHTKGVRAGFVVGPASYARSVEKVLYNRAITACSIYPEMRSSIAKCQATRQYGLSQK